MLILDDINQIKLIIINLNVYVDLLMNNSFLNKIIIFYNIMDNQNVVNFKIKNKFLL